MKTIQLHATSPWIFILCLVLTVLTTGIGFACLIGCSTFDYQEEEYRPSAPSAPLCVPGARMAHVRVLSDCNDIIIGPREAGPDIEKQKKALGMTFDFKLSSNLVASKLAKQTGQCRSEVTQNLSARVQQSIESALKGKGYFLVPNAADADLLVTVTAHAVTMRQIQQISAMGGDERTYECAKRCKTTSCPGFSWQALSSVQFTVSANYRGIKTAGERTFVLRAPARNPRDSQDETNSPRIEYFCDIDEAEGFVNEDSLYGWGRSMTLVLQQFGPTSLSLFCAATGQVRSYKQSVRRQVVEWVDLPVQRSTVTIKPTRQSLAQVHFALTNLAECTDGSPYSLRLELEDETTIRSCPVPIYGPPILAMEVSVRNGMDHILWLKEILPLLVTSDGVKLSPTAPAPTIRTAWTIDRQAAVLVQSPHDKDNRDRVATKRILSLDVIDGLADAVPPWSLAGFVLPNSQERFLLTFDLSRVVPVNSDPIRFTVGFYDAVVDTNRAGEPSVRGTVLFDGTASVVAEVKQFGRLIMKDVQETMTPDGQVGTVEIPRAASGADSKPLAVVEPTADSKIFMVRSIDDMADLTDFVRSNVGSKVVVRTNDGQTARGIIKGVWSMNLSVDVLGERRNISLGSILSVQVLDAPAE